MALKQQNGVTNTDAQSELEAVRTKLNSYVSGTCSTAAGTAAKTMSASNFALREGAMVCVKFSNTNTASNPTINVNSTGAKSIYLGGSPIAAGELIAGNIYTLRYDGTQYEIVNATAADTQLATLQTQLIRWTDRITGLELWAANDGYQSPSS